MEGNCYECDRNESCDFNEGICISYDTYEIFVTGEGADLEVEITPIVAHAFIAIPEES